ncbi:hypothetical protein RRG08_027998 [Elysia crispata]|uniref:Uncharacterized protein n=1 Tax=Elysia crispata TaxID=231223 RepID=A0AAE1BCZ9_9GAST|nr:hypothetical protein RRG08_027998 [Elysia crispata]
MKNSKFKGPAEVTNRAVKRSGMQRLKRLGLCHTFSLTAKRVGNGKKRSLKRSRYCVVAVLKLATFLIGRSSMPGAVTGSLLSTEG